MTKYIVSGYIGFNNFGDEAIARVLVEQLQNSGAEKITLISSNPEKTKKLHNVNSCSMLGFLKPMTDADVLISGGGSLLQDTTSLKSLIYYLLVINAALFMHKEVRIFAQGIGPINSFIGKTLTKYTLRHVHKISVRDKISQELLKSWNINSDLVQDPIFSINIEPKNSKGIVGIQLRKFQGADNKFLETLADEIISRFPNKKFEILSLQDAMDLEICRDFGSKLAQKGAQEVEIINGMNINDVFSRISNLEFLIAMRFHASVVGIKSGVKTLAINYDPKVEKLAKEYNLPYINLDLNNRANAFNKLISIN